VNKLWCPLPWTHLSVKNNGTLRMCSHSQSGGNKNTVLTKDNKELNIDDLENIDVMNSDNLKQVRKDILNNIWPEQCRRCNIESSAGHRSRNEWESIRHKDTFTYEQAIKNTSEDGTIHDIQIQSFDLRLGNPCNLRCVMCFPGEATKWYKDYKEIIGDDVFTVDNKVYNLDPKEGDFDWIRSEEKVQSLINSSQQLNKIKFGGGEPLMIKKHYDIIKGLIEKGYAKDIELEYSSNITVFPQELFELWPNFKIIKICASLDAIGIANEAIRYPSKWDTVEKNLKMLDSLDDKFIIFTSTTIGLLSLEHYARTLLWLQEKDFKKINKDVHLLSASHPIYAPHYLNIGILEQHQAKRIFNELKEEIINSSVDLITKSAIIDKVNFYQNYYELVKIPNVNIYRKQFSERFYRFANNQKQDWDMIFPQAARIAKEWT
jgi:organic radical activating enzyme